MKPTVAAAVASPPDTIRVLIVDDEPLFTEMIEAMLTAEDGIEVVGRGAQGKDAVRLAAELDPDVVVMDISMPVLNGIDATREICERDPEASVLILTGGSSAAEVDDARKAGAAAYLTKDRIANELISEIRSLGTK